VRRVIVAAAAGAALYALALPPFDWAVAGWVALLPLLLAIRGLPTPRAFACGAVYGCVCGWAVTWWLTQAVTLYFGLGVLPAALAMSAAYVVACGAVFGLFAAGVSVLRSAHPLPAVLSVPALWVAIELLRGRLLGQPWALLGYTQYAHQEVIQLAALTGVYGISFMLAASSTGVAEALGRLASRQGAIRALRPLAAATALVAGLVVLGTVQSDRNWPGSSDAGTVAVVQTNVPPTFRWTRAYAERQLSSHLVATDSLSGPTQPALIVWPEHAVPQYLSEEPGVAAVLGALAARHRADLLLGVPRYEAGKTYNSAQLITSQGRNGGHYDKRRLVVFAESTPLAPPAPAAPSESPRSFSAGRAPAVLQSFVRLGVSICHEILYPDLIGGAVAEGAELLVNIANDGWLDGGYGVASRQHFAMAVFRAVETRRYLVRAATTGISGVVDPYGRVVAALEPNVAGVLTTDVVGRRGLTPYVRFGDVFAFACLLLAALAVGLAEPTRAWFRAHRAPTAGAAPAAAEGWRLPVRLG
jgi:apolipoprotein N-acyltransferase